MLEDRQTAIVFRVIVQPHPMHGLAQDARQRRLTNFDGFSAQIGAVQFKQIKCIQECPWLVPPVTSTWNAATPLSSQQTTSPSIRQERTFRWLTACTTSGNRGVVQSLPLRESKWTRTALVGWGGETRLDKGGAGGR